MAKFYHSLKFNSILNLITFSISMLIVMVYKPYIPPIMSSHMKVGLCLYSLSGIIILVIIKLSRRTLKGRSCWKIYQINGSLSYLKLLEISTVVIFICIIVLISILSVLNHMGMLLLITLMITATINLLLILIGVVNLARCK